MDSARRQVAAGFGKNWEGAFEHEEHPFGSGDAQDLSQCYVHGVMDGEALKLFETQMQVAYIE